MNKRILYLIQQAGSLMQMPRSHKRSLGNTFDTVASHSFHVAIIAYCIARMEKLSHADATTAMMMGLMHDLPEARTGDMDFVAKNYTKVDEPKAIDDQFADIDFGTDLKKVVDEYEDRQSIISKCAKDADSVEQIYQEWVLSWQGNKLANQWFEGDFTHRVPMFFTESAKQIALSMKDSDPNKWWWAEFVEKGIDYKHLNGKGER
jgi:putative hydrolase of HD superfamily